MAQRVLSCRQTKGGTQERPPSSLKEGTSGPRNQTITDFFKPTQTSDVSTLNSPHKRSNESLNLLSCGVEASAKKTPSKRRKIAMASPTKSLIMEAFLQKGKSTNHSLVSGFQTHCTKCHASLISPKVVLKKLSLPKLSREVSGKEDDGQWTFVLGNQNSANCNVRGMVQPKCSGKSSLNPSLFSIPFSSRGSELILNVLETTKFQPKICSSQTPPLTSKTSKAQGAYTPSLKKYKMQLPCKAENTILRSDEVKAQVNKALNSPYDSDEGSGKCSFVSKHISSSNISSSQTSGNSSSQISCPPECQYIGNSKKELIELPNSSTPAKQVAGLKSGTRRSISCMSPHPKECPLSATPLEPVTKDDRIEGILVGLASFPSGHPNGNATENSSLAHPQPTKYSFLEKSLCSGAEHSFDSSCSSRGALRWNGSHKRRRYSSDSDGSNFNCSILSTDEEEELQPLEEILSLVSKPVPATPQKSCLDLSQLSSIQSPAKKMTFKTNSTKPYVNSLDKLVKEKMESERLADMEKKLNEDLERGLGMLSTQYTESSDEGELEEEHKIFMKKYSMVSNTIPDENPGEEVFCLEDSGHLFSHCTLDLRNFRFSSHSPEENLIFSCDTENQILLATEGFLSHLYKFKKCPVFLMKWLFQMTSVHPSFSVSHRILNTLMEITCNSLSSPEAQHSLWTPSLLDVTTVFVNMGIHFQTLFPFPHLQPPFGIGDLTSAIPECTIAGKNGTYSSEQIQILEMHITCVIKFLSFCIAVHPESYDDREALLLLVMVLKIYLEKRLRHILVVDLHCLVKHILQNFKDWETKMSELCLAVSQLSVHHHNFVTLVQLIPASDIRGRQLRRQLGLMFIAKLLDENPTSLPTDYDSQMLFLCRCFVHMKPTSLVKKMQKHSENAKSDLELEYEAYYLTSSLLNLMTDASSSDENPSTQRKYVQKLCTALEKHIKCDIHEDARFFYRTQVKDLVARIYGKWQELLHYSRPNQGKLHDYWEPAHDTPGTSQE